jgi:uncharacterized membrane protein YraQ (UPF0718 family)
MAAGSAAPQPRSETGHAVQEPQALFNRTAQVFYAVAALGVVLVIVLRGPGVLGEALWETVRLALFVTPMVAAGLFLGGLARSMLDASLITPVLGKESGWRGLWLATLLGFITPGGPYTAFPIVYALYISGADIGATIAYLTAWCLMGIQRLVNWEIPFLGIDFVIIRMLLTAPLIVLGGALARILANGILTVPTAEEMQDRRR